MDDVLLFGVGPMTEVWEKKAGRREHKRRAMHWAAVTPRAASKAERSGHELEKANITQAANTAVKTAESIGFGSD
jgi:hypothetical protein